MTITPTDLRLQVLANGYTPLANFDKRTFTPGWPKLVVTPELIQSKAWARSRANDATGIRVEGGLCVIDLDINLDRETIDIVAAAIDRIVPGLSQKALVRFGKGFKEAWFLRTDEPFSRIHGHGWIAPGQAADDGAHRVEIFGGASPRQFGAFGAHTKLDDGTVTVTYEWDGPSPLDTPLASLPVVDKATLFRVVDAIDAQLEVRGWQKVTRSQKGESDVHRVYDLTEDMSFDLSDGRTLSLPELRAIAGDESTQGLRCSAGWLEGDIAVNRSRCIIGTSRQGHLTIWESAAGTTHMEAALKPKDFTLDLDRAAEKLKELEARVRHIPREGDSAVTVAAKLLATHAWCPSRRAPVLPLWAGSVADGGMSLTNFRITMLPYAEEELGPRGGRVVTNPVDIWSGSTDRVTVKGVQMRPDQPRPVFTDATGTWVNAYAPPELPVAGGDPDIGIEFIEHLLPNERERKYFLQWLAFKRQRPDIPGPAVVMVARSYGTGRGTLFQLIGHLFGQRYVKQVPFHIFAGRSYQSQYNDWAAEALFACVAESVDTSGDGSAYKAKVDLYEHLKEVVEPRPTLRTYVVKGEKAFEAPSVTTYLIATNHVDALALPESDRRIAVLANGEAKDEAYWLRVNTWMEDEANVAAFGRWLDEEIDLSDYSPFVAPLTTDAKRLMVDMAKSDLDAAFDASLKALPGAVFAPEQVINVARRTAALYGLDLPEKWQPMVKKMVQRQCHRVGIPHGTNWMPMIGNRRYPVYARTAQMALRWTEDALLRQELLKNGDPDAGPMATNVIVGSFVDPQQGTQ